MALAQPCVAEALAEVLDLGLACDSLYWGDREHAGRLALSAVKPNKRWHDSLGFVALLLNPTYGLSPMQHTVGA